VHEDIDKLGRKDRNRLTNACDKQFTSLARRIQAKRDFLLHARNCLIRLASHHHLHNRYKIIAAECVSKQAETGTYILNQANFQFK